MKKYRILPLLLIVCLLLTAAFPAFAANSTASTAEQSPEPTANAASDGVPQSMVQAQEGSYVLGSNTVKTTRTAASITIPATLTPRPIPRA